MRITFLLITLSIFINFFPCKSETLIDEDFSRPGDIASQPVANRCCKGTLPTGWQDNSSFAKVDIEYSFGDEQGTRFQRTNLRRIEKDWAQLCIHLPDAPDRRLYRLSINCRNLTSGNIDIGLRRIGKPYGFYWDKNTNFTRNWENREWEFELPKNDAPMGLWICIRNEGIFDIRSLKLERFSKEEIIAEIKAKHKDKGPANLVRVSRFPLGLPSGWSITRELSDIDCAVYGPAESQFTPAAKIQSPKPLIVYSSPIEISYPLIPHSASLEIRGSGRWTLKVQGQGLKSETTSFNATDQWQRVKVDFNPSYNSRWLQLILEGEGTLYVDRLQAGPVEKYTGRYQPPVETEVTVALAPGFDAGAARIIFDDENAAINIAVTGDLKDKTVHWRLFDIEGKQLKEERIPAKPRSRITRIPAVYGTLRFEVLLEKEGRQVSPADEVVFYRLHRPRYWGRDAPQSPFAVHTLSTTRHIIMAKAIGINWTRLHDAGLSYCGWWNLEPEKGNWRFFDEELMRYRKHGIRIFAELGTAPAWASYYQDSGLKSFGYFDKFFQPKNLDDYANYVRVFCNRYKDEIDAFDVWNEPWIHGWWGVGYDHSKQGRAGYITSEKPQADFVRLTAVAHREVHKIIPHAQVFGVNTTTSGDVDQTKEHTCMGGTQWTEGIVEAGGLNRCDGIAFHAYTTDGVGYPGDSVERGLSNAVGRIAEEYKENIPKPVWMTEGSPLIHRMGNGIYDHVFPGERVNDLMESANRIVRYHVSMLANGVSRMFIYSMHSHDGIFRDSSKQWNAFTTDDGFLHPSGAAHSYLAWMLEDTRFKECRPVGKGVYAYIFEGEKRAVAVLSSESKFDPLPIPQSSGIRATDLFGNPLSKNAVFNGNVVYLEADTVANFTF